jgi:hypothetical protein
MARSDARALDRHLHGTVAISGETANKLCVFATGKVMAELDGLRLGEVADWSVTGPEHGVLRSEFVRARLYASVPLWSMGWAVQSCGNGAGRVSERLAVEGFDERRTLAANATIAWGRSLPSASKDPIRAPEAYFSR